MNPQNNGARLTGQQDAPGKTAAAKLAVTYAEINSAHRGLL